MPNYEVTATSLDLFKQPEELSLSTNPKNASSTLDMRVDTHSHLIQLRGDQNKKRRKRSESG